MSSLRKDKMLATERPAYRYRYVVEGNGQFPIDMLRYDSAVPYDQEAVSYMMASGRRKVMLQSYSAPSPERWASFGWRIT